MIATFHPAALLRNEGLKRDAYGDLLKIRAKLDELTAKKEPPEESDGKAEEETEK